MGNQENQGRKRILYRVPTVEDQVMSLSVTRSALPTASAPGRAFIPANPDGGAFIAIQPRPQVAETGSATAILTSVLHGRYGRLVDSEWASELEITDEIYDPLLVEELLPSRFFRASELGSQCWVAWATKEMERVLHGKFPLPHSEKMVQFMASLLQKAVDATFTPELLPLLRASAPRNFAVAPPKTPLDREIDRLAMKQEMQLGTLLHLQESDRRLQAEIDNWLEFFDEYEEQPRVSPEIEAFIREVEDFLCEDTPTWFDDVKVPEQDFFPSLYRKNERAKREAAREFDALPKEYKRGIDKATTEIPDDENLYKELSDEALPASPVFSPKYSRTPTKSPFFQRGFLARSSMTVLREETQ